MKAYERVKKFVEIETVRGLIRVMPHISDERLLAFTRSEIERIPFADGREFARKLLVLGKQTLQKVSPSCRKRATENFLINAILRGVKQREDYADAHGVQPPFLIVISPTMRCNLRCYGCYAGAYSKDEDLPRNVFDRVLQEAKEMGIYFVTISGGEPFVSRDALDMFEKHDDMYFQVYTNGTLIDEAMATRLSELGNVFPAISVEGFEKETEQRRGKGVFQKVLRAMDVLRERGVPFGFSATATRQNNELIVSDEFIKFYADRGCFLGWYFQYIPIGREPQMDLVPTPQQRIYRLRRLREARRKFPILLADFWNDGPLTGGCLAGGTYYLHINVHGDVEPCVFAHFAVDNVKNKSLGEVLQSDFFKAIRRCQPFNKNHLRPCMIIDNPHMLRQLAREHCAHPTHEGAETILNELAPKVDEIAAEYGKLADEEWARNYEPVFRSIASSEQRAKEEALAGEPNKG